MKKAFIALVCLAVLDFSIPTLNASADPTTDNTSQAPSTTSKKKVKKRKTTTTTTTTTTAPVEGRHALVTTNATPEEQTFRFSATASLGMDDGNFGFGAGFRADYPIQISGLNFRVGAETGIYRFSWSTASYTLGATTTASYGASVIVIPIVASGSYDFVISNLGITPFARTTLGLDIAMAKADSGISGVSTSQTNAKFHFTLEPGLRFDHDLLFASVPFGTMAGGFLLMPTFGIRF